MSTRTVTVYATKGQRRETVETAATTWGELKGEVAAKGFDLETLSATESVNRTNLQHRDASLPAGNFTLFLRPTRTKSGIEGAEDMQWRELREAINDAIQEDGDEAREHFDSHPSGKNYTQLGTSQLRELVGSYVPLSEREEEEEIEEEYDEYDGHYEENCDSEPVNAAKVRQAKQLLDQVCEDTNNEDVCDRVEEIKDMMDGIIADLDDDDLSPEEKAELDRLAREANELEDGFE